MATTQVSAPSRLLGPGTEEQGDQPKQRMDAHGNPCNRKAQVEAGGGRDLEKEHGLDVFGRV
ncbi:MAG: hypothetical protein HND47_20250 [Chloroflexi bacterium]|nr:hypothetical protein [Chloroflexota bacterium]